MPLKDIFHSRSLNRAASVPSSDNNDYSEPAASDQKQMSTSQRSSEDALLKGDEKEPSSTARRQSSIFAAAQSKAYQQQLDSQPRRASKVEQFLQKHGMHELGTEPQDVEQTRERNKLIAAIGGIYIPSTQGNGVGDVKK